MTSFLWLMIVGLVVGALAKAVMPGRQGGGIIVTMLLGLAGAFVAGIFGHATGLYAVGEGPGFIASFLGALSLLFGARVWRQHKIRQAEDKHFGGPGWPMRWPALATTQKESPYRRRSSATNDKSGAMMTTAMSNVANEFCTLVSPGLVLMCCMESSLVITS